jgi:polyisoprenoid-binding protein YceI/thiol-disulfide isomerase/thioredoxin
MNRIIRAAVVAATLLLLALVVRTRDARASEEFDVKEELAYPGTRLLVVEFYSVHCEPCMAAVQKWSELHAKYRSEGLRFVVIKADDDDGRCVQLKWSPDRSICDTDNEIHKSMRVNALPYAFVWSWTGELLVNGGHVAQVERVVEEQLVKMPRAAIRAEGADRELAHAERFVRAELTRIGKIQAVATEAEEKAIEALRRRSTQVDRDERAQCEQGKALGANSLLTLSLGKGAAPKLLIELLDATTNCPIGTGRALWEPANPERSVSIAVADLLAHVTKRPQLPWLARKASPTDTTTGGRDKPTIPVPAPAGSDGDDDVLVSFTSIPPGAKVEVDGALACQATPCKKMLRPGRRMVGMSSPCTNSREEKVRFTGDRGELNWTLTEERAPLKVELADANGEPYDGEVRVDGRSAGRTWKTLQVPICAKEVAVSTDHGTWTQALSLTRTEMSRVRGKLEPACAPGSHWTGKGCDCNADTPEWNASAQRCVPPTAKPASPNGVRNATGSRRFVVDGAHSQIGFRVKHMMVSTVRGVFKSFNGTVSIDDADLTKSRVKVEIDTASVDTGIEKRDEHLKSPDFFDATRNPKITFESTSVRKQGATLLVNGDLAMHGVTKPITLSVVGPTKEWANPWGQTLRGASATAKINRRDFGLQWNKVTEAGAVVVSDEVDLELDLTLVLADGERR